MPKIYQYFGLAVLIYTNDHQPIHVHVRDASGRQCIIEIILKDKKIIDIRKRKNEKGKELPSTQCNTALKLVTIKAEELVRAWHQIKNGTWEQKTIVITRRIV